MKCEDAVSRQPPSNLGRVNSPEQILDFATEGELQFPVDLSENG